MPVKGRRVCGRNFAMTGCAVHAALQHNPVNLLEMPVAFPLQRNLGWQRVALQAGLGILRK